MKTIDRRRFLQIGTTGAALSFATGASRSVAAAATQPVFSEQEVRLSGDGLGLTPTASIELLARLTDENAIASDSYSNGGVVEELEQAFAAALGKERAVFMPTGTLANHLAVRMLAGGPSRAIVQAESHLYNDTGDTIQTLSDIQLVPLAFGQATFTLEDVRALLDRTASGRVATPVSVISIESPVRRKSGELFDEAEMDRITAFARQEGIRTHLDGARIFLQAGFTGRSVADYAQSFDTVYVSLYKYFNAPSGAILAGPSALLDQMFHVRRMFGAGLAKVWPFAAIALHYFQGFPERYARAVGVAREWTQLVGDHEAFSTEPIPAGTNLFLLKVHHADLNAFRDRLARQHVRLPAPLADGSGFRLGVNETWGRTTASDLAAMFVQAAET